MTTTDMTASHILAPENGIEHEMSGPYRTAATSRGTMDGSVSEQWASRPDDQRFLNLYDLRNAVYDWYCRSYEYEADRPGDIRIIPTRENHGLKFTMPGDDREFVPSNYSFGQLTSLTGVPARLIQRQCEEGFSDLASLNLTFGLAQRGDPLKAYLMTPEAGSTGPDELRAMTSTSYGRVPDHEVVENLIRVAGDGVGETRWKVPGTIDWRSSIGGTVMYDPHTPVTRQSTTLYASDRDVWCFLVDDTHPIEIGRLPDGSPDLVFRGIIVSNSEVGSKTLSMRAFLLRGICQNRCLWGIERSHEVRIRHTMSAPERLANELAPALLEYSEASIQPTMARITAARDAGVIRPGGEDRHEAQVDFLTNRLNFTKKVAERIVGAHHYTEGRPMESAWDVAMGITAYARTIEHADQRVEVETIAGKFLDRVA